MPMNDGHLFRVLTVDDQLDWASSLRGVFGEELVDLYSFQRASHVLCWLNENSQDASALPDIALIDIEFHLVGDDDATSFSNVAVSQREQRPTAQLGWPIASRLKEICSEHGHPCEIIMYTGHGDILRDFRDAVRAIRHNAMEIPPFIPLFFKDANVAEDIFPPIAEAAVRVGQRFVQRFGVDTALLHEFEQFCTLDIDEWRKVGRPRCLELYKPILSLFPVWGKQWLDCGGTSRLAGKRLRCECQRVDLNWVLCNAFKKLKSDATNNVGFYRSPLAAAIHRHGWPRPNDCIAKEELLCKWLATECPLPRETKDRIVKTGASLASDQTLAADMVWPSSVTSTNPKTSLEVFACAYGHEKRNVSQAARRKWESSFSCQSHAFSWSCTGDACERTLLTDWEHLFGASGLLRQIGEMAAEGRPPALTVAQDGEDETMIHAQLHITLDHDNHVADKLNGDKGEAIRALKYWSNRCSYEATDGTGWVQRVQVWPRSDTIEKERACADAGPFLRIHWDMRDYLRMRAAESSAPE